MYEVGVVAQFEAAHRLHGDFGAAGRVHGHTYRVEVVARGAQLGDDGTLGDLGILKDAVQGAVSALDYRDLNALPEFQDRNPTAEVVARHLFDVVARTAGAQLRARGVSALAIRLWESPLAWAGYEATLD